MAMRERQNVKRREARDIPRFSPGGQLPESGTDSSIVLIVSLPVVIVVLIVSLPVVVIVIVIRIIVLIVVFFRRDIDGGRRLRFGLRRCGFL